MGRREEVWVLRPVRLGRRGGGEVAIGLRARRARWRRLLVGVFGLLLISGAVGVYLVLRPPGGPTSSSYSAKVFCHSCGFGGVLRVSTRERPPRICPRCGQRTAQDVWRCEDCGHEFVPGAETDERRCPECGSGRVGTPLSR